MKDRVLGGNILGVIIDIQGCQYERALHKLCWSFDGCYDN